MTGMTAAMALSRAARPAGLIAMRYARMRWHQPRLLVNHEGIYCGTFYPWESIRKMQTVMRALKITVMQDDGRVKEKVLNLGWASNADFKLIVEILTARDDVGASTVVTSDRGLIDRLPDGTHIEGAKSFRDRVEW